MKKNEVKTSAELVNEILVNNINTGKPCRICIEKHLSGEDEWLQKRYNLCVTYNAHDDKGAHFAIYFGWDFCQLSKETQTFLIDTEIAHIARGHMKTGRIFSNYSKYLNNNSDFNRAADLYAVYKGHQKYDKKMVLHIFDELDNIPMTEKDKKEYARRKLHILRIVECLEKRDEKKCASTK